MRLTSVFVPYKSSVKYLGVHLDECLTYAIHVRIKRTELNLRFRCLYWLLVARSFFSVSNRQIITLRVIWFYVLPIWRYINNSNHQFKQRFQNKLLRSITGASWFPRNNTLNADLCLPTVAEAIDTLYHYHNERLYRHSNILALELLDNSLSIHRLPRRHCVNPVS